MSEVAPQYFGKAAFREYVFLMLELERLFRQGEGQSAQADAIRDAMDGPSDKLTEAEHYAIGEFADELTKLGEQFRSVLPDGDSTRIVSSDTVRPSDAIEAGKASADHRTHELQS